MKGLHLVLILSTAMAWLPAQDSADGPTDEAFRKKVRKLRKKVLGITLEVKSSALWRKKYNWGFPRKPDDRKNSPELRKWMEARIAERKAWVASQKEVMAEANIRHATIIETKNFLVYWTIPRWTVGQRRLNLVKGGHLFAQRLQEVADRFEEITGVLPSALQRLYLMGSTRDNRLVTAHLMGVEHDNGFTRFGLHGQWCSWPDPARPRLLRDDERFHAHVLHGGVNLLTSASTRFQLDLVAWFQVGMSHLLEHEKFGLVRNFDFKEVQAKSNWTSNWKKKIFREVSSRKAPSFASVASMDVDQMNYHENAYAWSYLDFLLTRHDKKFPAFFRMMKQTNDTKKTISEIFGWSTASFQEHWQSYVRKSYGMR